ncbi:hypothetical protein NQZ68_032555 [Dissostichus eleginoides]|nr:hypothetical protein NQZ68_032555 [Dissostichus eleginoides]
MTGVRLSVPEDGTDCSPFLVRELGLIRAAPGMLRYYTPQDVGKKKQRGQPLSGETLKLCASPGSALFVRRKKRPLVTREKRKTPIAAQ